MTALPPEVAADLERRVAELEKKLQSALGERNDAIAREAAMGAETARLHNALGIARDRQNASADILRTIATVSGDAGRSLQQIAETTARLFGAPSVSIQLAENGEWTDTFRFGTSAERVRAAISLATIRVGGRNLPGTVVTENRQVHIPDLDHLDPSIADWPGPPLARAAGTRTMCGTPLRREGKAIGALIVYRDRLAPFTDEELALQQSFADQAAIAIENARLFNETQEALERQTATAEILKVIASSPSDTTPVFEAIASSAKRLLGGFSTAVFRFLDGTVHLAAFTPTSPAADQALRTDFPQPVENFEAFRLAQDGKPFPIPDTEEVPHAPLREIARLHGFRSMLWLPMVNGGVTIGVISVTRAQPGAFASHHVELLQTFADQAVIAIENARLFNETREALERQTATAEILKVIASSPSDVQPVFDAIAASANRLLGGFSSTVFRFIDGMAHLKAFTPTTPEADEILQSTFPRPVADFAPFQMTQAGEVMQIPDTEAPTYELKEIARARGYRSMLYAPLMNKGVSIGFIAVTRVQPGTFANHHVQLLKTFADQAVIALENARLFEEVQAKTRDLTESLQQQTATADVLKVISRSAFDLQTVLDTLVESAARLCEADMAAITRQKGDAYFRAGSYGFGPEFMNYVKDIPVKAERATIIGRTLLEGKVTHVPDVHSDPDYSFPEGQRLSGDPHTILGVPLLREGNPVGALALLRRAVRPFTDKQIELVTTFADQAVIAIENVRLFDEVQARTRDLQEALTYQTGSANILKVIASSPTDVGPALNTIVESACELCAAYDAIVVLGHDSDLVLSAHHGPIPMHQTRWSNDRTSVSGRAIADRSPVHLRDVLSDEGAEFPVGQEMSRRDGCHTILSVPLLREGESVGAISLRRTEVNPFSEKQITLLQSFADQAVIAIGNVRLFEEVQAKTRDLTESLQQQTATAEVLKVISRSAFDLQKVLDTLSESAARLCESDIVVIHRRIGEGFRGAASFGLPEEHHRAVMEIDHKPGRGSLGARVLLENAPVLIDDAESDPEYTFGSFARWIGMRSMLGVPLMREGAAIGLLLIFRKRVQPFTRRHVDLAAAFADQAVIAIENVRLFDEVQARTKELAASLDDLRTAQDRLVQTEKLASLGQLTAGIAHEIKNPLNFVNNFAALSAELIDELTDLLKPTTLDGNTRKEANELTQTLKDNLEKIVQHGKRADSIVKNMLLHSREGSGEHRPSDINALLDESLNLAYHGARAEQPQFNVTLQRDFDASAGAIELFPQEITRVFLNLIANGFYAVTKRKAELGNSGYEPRLSATTRNLGNTVEIRIRDNGIGIPAEVKEKMFNPFFTTKPAGEGTGLGLSMSHDIIVKQHGGTIDVETEPGQFTEFTIVLPRTSSLHDQKRGQT